MADLSIQKSVVTTATTTITTNGTNTKINNAATLHELPLDPNYGFDSAKFNSAQSTKTFHDNNELATLVKTSIDKYGQPTTISETYDNDGIQLTQNIKGQDEYGQPITTNRTYNFGAIEKEALNGFDQKGQALTTNKTFYQDCKNNLATLTTSGFDQHSQKITISETYNENGIQLTQNIKGKDEYGQPITTNRTYHNGKISAEDITGKDEHGQDVTINKTFQNGIMTENITGQDGYGRPVKTTETYKITKDNKCQNIYTQLTQVINGQDELATTPAVPTTPTIPTAPTPNVDNAPLTVVEPEYDLQEGALQDPIFSGKGINVSRFNVEKQPKL